MTQRRKVSDDALRPRADKLGDRLRGMFDVVSSQPTPPELLDLVEQLDEGSDQPAQEHQVSRRLLALA